MFKKSKNILKENVDNALSVCSKVSKEDMNNKFYVDEKLKLASVLIILSQETYKTKKRVFTETEFNNILKIYLKTWEIAHNSFADKKQLSQHINENVFTEFKDSSEFPFSTMVRASMVCIKYIRESDKNLNTEEFLLDKSTPQGNIKFSSNEDIEKFLKKEEEKEKNIKIIAEYNKDIEDKDKKTDDYGLTPQNPIFVCGTLACEQYFNHLYDSDENKLKFEQLGVMTTVGISGTIDAFRAYYEKDKEEIEVGIIYVSIFGNKVNTCPPVGYLYK